MQSTKNRKTSATVTSTDLVRHFSDYLARVRYGGQTLVVERNNKPVAELRPLPSETCTLRELVEEWQSQPPDPEWADALESVNRADTAEENPWP